MRYIDTFREGMHIADVYLCKNNIVIMVILVKVRITFYPTIITISLCRVSYYAG